MKMKKFPTTVFIFFIFILLSSYSAISFSLGFFSHSDMNPNVYHLALKAYNTALQAGIKTSKHLLTIIDYSLPSQIPRLWVIDVNSNKILFRSLVAHGQGSGENTPSRFSDKPGTLASSLGLFVTEETYAGKRGLSLKLKGLEKGFNAHAESRGIVMHPAWYVSEDMAKKYGRLGRSWGCPAVEPKLAKPLINTIKDGTLVFAYYPDKKWLNHSAFLNQPNRG